MSTTAKPPWTLPQVVGILQTVPLFEGLPRADLERVAQLMRGKSVATGEMIFREGDAGDRFYVVFTGAVEILKERPRGNHERLAVKRAGEAFGEMSLLNDAPRSASVRAAEPTQLLVVSREQFIDILGGETLAVRLMRGLARALRALDVRFAARETAASDAGSALRQFNHLLQQGMIPRAVPRLEGFDIAARMVQSDEGMNRAVWDLAPFGGGTLLAVLDMRGGGLPPAHLLSIARALLRQEARHAESFAAVLTAVNEALGESLFEGLDACVEVGLVGLDAHGARFAAAGDQPALVVRADGAVEEMAAHGPALGILPRFDYGATELALQPGDVLAVFSELEMGIVRGAGDLIARYRGESAARLADMLEVVLRQLQAQRGGDDVTFTLVRRQ